MPTRKRHIPQRTCVACRRARPKRELVRVVRALDGHVCVDASGRAAGRGAYLCRTSTCWELALKRKRLEHALMTSIAPEDGTALAVYALTLPPSDNPPVEERRE